ncbi:hypothetical protein [Flagellimonas flava]|uniref:Uncharacterized protein n=1 Tax=Flagellimonas flava TaxID=570519 RepID=A0A1M5HUV7_9FLAO|nr:hypothetical protein [Allomuricauda flava]SHG19730.1 hypothetical protein SAMN04488116_0216 [Allomuricauda flava]
MALNIYRRVPFFGFMKTEKLTKTQKKQLSRFIVERYGSPQEFAKVLDRNLEMLFYIEEEVFTPREVQGVVSALRGIIVALRQKKQAGSKQVWFPLTSGP